MLSAPEVIQSTEAEPVTLDQVKTFLRIDGTALDFQLELMMKAAQDDLELLTGLRMIDQVVRVRADDPADLEHLTVGPVTDLVAIGRLLPGGAIDPLPVEAFELTGAKLHRGVRPIGTVAPANGRPIVVDLAIGFGADAAAVPSALRLALLLLVRGRYDETPADVERLVFNWRINA